LNGLRVWLESAYSRPQNYVFWGFDPLNGEVYQRGTSLHGKTSYDVLMVKIDPPVWTVHVPNKPKKDRKKPYCGNWLFAQTTDVIRLKYRLAIWMVFGQQ